MNSIVERWMIRSERWMYRAGRPGRVAVALNGAWAWVAAHGLGPGRLVTLEVVGRRTGRHLKHALVVVEVDDARYLVAMRGERARWVANVRDAKGRAVLWHGRPEPVILEEVEPGLRAPIIRRHLDLAPAARSFVPIDRHAPAAAFASVAVQIPVFRIGSPLLPAGQFRGTHESDRPTDPVPTAEETPMSSSHAPDSIGTRTTGRRRRHWRRWLLGAVLGILVMAFGVAAAFVNTAPPPLTLPAPSAGVAGATLDGSWAVGNGSVAGFRIQQTILGLTGYVAGRTQSVTGTVSISGNEIIDASFSVELPRITSGGKAIPQFEISLDTNRYPTATIRLAKKIAVPAGFASGSTVSMSVPATLQLRDQTQLVTVSLTARRDGDRLEAVGSIPVAFGDFGIRGPNGYGILASLADRATAEFLLVLVHG